MNDSLKTEPPPVWTEEPAATGEPEDADGMQAVEYFKQARLALTHQLAKVIVGQEEVIDQLLIAIFTRNHALLVGVPGLAKTLLISTLAQTMSLAFKRIQFTPDLVPADLIGTRVYNQKNSEFATVLGPVFANLVLADEINRAPAKVQSALLEVMQERQVTIAGEAHRVPSPFVVMATQNPSRPKAPMPCRKPRSTVS